MKNFILGILITLVGGLLFQNIHLRQELVASNKMKPKATMVAKKTSKPKTQVQVVQQTPEPQAIAEYNPSLAAAPYKDPRCPDHLPYWTSYWGCVVKRP